MISTFFYVLQYDQCLNINARDDLSVTVATANSLYRFMIGDFDLTPEEKQEMILFSQHYIENTVMEVGEMSFRFLHICEVCGKKEILTPEEAFEKGWDYPPKIGFFGIVSPRTCGDCSVMDTLWWAICKGNLRIPQDLDAHQKEVLYRILGEPASIFVDP